ncbi:MAG: metallophosphoesterase family protein [Solirubrobacterales bacterium]
MSLRVQGALALVFATSLCLLGYGAGDSAGEERPRAKRSWTIVAAGDIGDNDPSPYFQDDTAQLTARLNPDRVLALGDIAYESGSLADFMTNYHPWWGRFNPITHPVPGNHEAYVSDRGYDAYFGRGKHNYSFNLGSWHLIGLDTNYGDATALRFLRRDLRRNRRRCLLMFLHHPLHSSGDKYAGGIRAVKPLYRAFYAERGDLVLTAHEHNYERFARQTPGGRAARRGYRQIVSGAGGQKLRGFSTVDPNSQKRISQHGVTRVVLKRRSYRASFIGVAGARDRVRRTACH